MCALLAPLGESAEYALVLPSLPGISCAVYLRSHCGRQRNTPVSISPHTIGGLYSFAGVSFFSYPWLFFRIRKSHFAPSCRSSDGHAFPLQMNTSFYFPERSPGRRSEPVGASGCTVQNDICLFLFSSVDGNGTSFFFSFQVGRCWKLRRWLAVRLAPYDLMEKTTPSSRNLLVMAPPNRTPVASG